MPITRPTTLPRWATGDPGYVEEPSEGKKDTGYSAERPGYKVFNWLLNAIYTWLSYFDLAPATRRWRGRANHDPLLARALGLPFTRSVPAYAHEYIEVTTIPQGRPCYDGEHIWVPCQRYLRKVDPATSEVVASVDLGVGYAAAFCAWDGEYVWAGCPHATDHKVVKVDPSDGTILETIVMPAAPWRGVYDGDGSLWVVNLADDLYEIDCESATLANTYAMTAGYECTDVCWDGDRLWVAAMKTSDSSAAIFKVDPADGGVEATVTSGLHGGGADNELAFDGGSLWMIGAGAHPATGYLDKVSVATAAHVSSIDMATIVGAQGVVFDGIHIWGLGSDGYKVVNVDTDEVVATGVLDSACQGTGVFDGSSVWIGCTGHKLNRKMVS